MDTGRRWLVVTSIVFTMAVFATAAAAAPAATGTSRAEDGRTAIAVTIYNNDLALVKETRKLTLEKGRNELRFMDVAARIDPRTVHLASLTDPAGLDVLEQNYEYDLISPDKLMQKFIGREVALVFDDGEDAAAAPREVRARLISTNGGLVYDIDGEYHINPPARVILPEIPGGLISVPTLVWLLDNKGRPAQTAEVSYLTGGLSWSADYVGVVDASDGRVDLTGWVTIDNASGATYTDAALKLVAGDVNRAEPEMKVMAMAAESGMRAQPAFAEESFFEYHLYTLDRPSTIKDRQTKQIALMEAPGVPVRKLYLLAGQPAYYRGKLGTLGRDLKVGVFLDLDNTAANGLGIPLPRGVIRLYKRDRSGSLQFVGEDRIDHTPKDETITLKTGDAFDVVADRTQTDFRATSGGRYDAEIEFRISIRNHKSEPVTVTVRDPVAGDWKVLESTLPPVKRDAHTIEFSVPVPADGEAVLVYRVAVDWN